MRIGIGYDAHRLIKGRKLILGGIEIPHSKGLSGHSDADVLTHAIMDALLGALALGTIGDFFPDTDPKYKDANSLDLLDQVIKIITDKGHKIQNIDTVIIAQNPKLAPYIEKIRQKLASRMQIQLDQISVKATTTEHMGFEGEEQGISSKAVVLIQDANPKP